MEKKYRAVFADLDRTLLNGEGKISQFTKDTIEKLLASGVDFLPCSGRSIKSFPEFLFGIKGIRHGVSSNGVSIDDMQKRCSLDHLVIPAHVPPRILEFLKDEDIYLECFLDGQGYTQGKYFDDPKAFDEITFSVEYIKTTRKTVDDMKEFIIANTDRIGSLDIIVHPGDSIRIFERLRAAFPEVYMTNSEKFLIEISNAGCGKHNGIKRYCQMFGISLQETVAFGDGNNDVEMISTAGLGIAVENATQQCKEAADRIAGKNTEDGVAWELCRMFNLH